MRTRQTYTRAFKIGVVQEVMRGDRPIGEICREHQIYPNVVLRWKREVEKRGDEAFTPTMLTEEQEKLLRIAELERQYEKLTLENQILKKGLELMQDRTDPRS